MTIPACLLLLGGVIGQEAQEVVVVVCLQSLELHGTSEFGVERPRPAGRRGNDQRWRRATSRGD